MITRWSDIGAMLIVVAVLIGALQYFTGINMVGPALAWASDLAG